MSKKAKTRAELEREVVELRAQLASRYHFAIRELPKASIDENMGSGVVIEITAVGGKSLVAPVLIRDGLSPETIAALQRDMARSYDAAMIFKP